MGLSFSNSSNHGTSVVVCVCVCVCVCACVRADLNQLSDRELRQKAQVRLQLLTVYSTYC